MKILSLSALLTPVSPDVFFSSFWPLEPLFIPPSESKLSELLGLPQLQNIEALIQARVLKVRACLPDYEDEYSSVHLEPQDALKAYRNNLTLVFDEMQTQSDLIFQFLLNIRADLGLPSGKDEDMTRARAMAYATPAGGGTRLHFDANVNFVVQLKGIKRWRLAPNHSVIHPTDRYTSGSGEISLALDKQCHAPLLEEMPEKHLEFLLEPGSVLFVPRGYWHETSAEENSLSLTLTFAQPTWADVYAKAIHCYLEQSPPWRELADGLQSRESIRIEAAKKRFEILAKEAARECAKLDFIELLGVAGLSKKADI